MITKKITIQFNNNPNDSEELLIKLNNVELFNFFFSELPVLFNNVVIIDDFAAGTAYNLYLFFITKYNLSGIYSAKRENNIVYIKLNIDDNDIISFDNQSANINIYEETVPLALSINDISFSSTDDNNCNKVKATFLTTSAVKVKEPYEIIIVNNTFSIDLLKGISSLIILEDADQNEFLFYIRTPEKLLLSNFIFEKTYDGIIVNENYNTNITGLIKPNIEFSLNNIDYFNNNYINNLQSGIYTLYIKDEFNCLITYTFELTQLDNVGAEINNNYFEIPKANPILFYKNDDSQFVNTKTRNSKCAGTTNFDDYQNQYWEDIDSTTLQFKNNYSDFKIIRTDNNNELDLIKKSSNIGKEISLDAKCYAVDNKLAIYMISGKIYDYNTGLYTGQDYDYGGVLPYWIKKGSIITINNNSYLIEDKGYNEQLYFEYFIINKLFISEDVVIKAKYNIEIYDVYETTVNFVGASKFKLNIFFNNKLQFISEYQIIKNKTMFKNFIIGYKHNKNTDMIWGTGINPIFRIPISKYTIYNDGDISIENLPNDTINTGFNNYEVDFVKTLPVTPEFARLIMLAVKHSNIFFNGLNYVLIESPNAEELDDSNLYIVTFKLRLTNKQDNIIIQEPKYKIYYASSSILASTGMLNNALIKI